MPYIIRHGKTDWNVRHKMQGRTDIPLNEEGRQMAEAAREEYRDVHFDICFCSPLIRARETAEILLRGRDVPIVTDNRLMEMSFGARRRRRPGRFVRPDRRVPPGKGRSAAEGRKRRTDCRSRRHELQHRLPGPAAAPVTVLERGH